MKHSPRGLVVLLAAMTAVGPFSIDTYLPAFPAIGAGLGVSAEQVQHTLAAYLLPFAFMMLWHGALADALGRRRVLLASFAVYALASLVCALAGSMEMLLLGRALQGLSAGGGMVVSRAVIRDLYDGPAAHRLIAHTGMIFAAAPAVAPVIGGWIHAFFDWHAIFIFLALYGIVLFVAVYRMLPETLPASERQSLHPVPLARAYGQVFVNPMFLALSVALAFSFNGFFVYVLSAPVFLMTHLHVSAQGFLWLFGPAMVGMMLGNYVTAKLAGRVSNGRAIGLGYLTMAGAALANVLLNLWLPPALPWAVLPIPFYLFGVAVAMPPLTLRVLDLFPERRGLVSSCQGTVQTGVNALTASLLAPLAWGSTLGMALAMASFFGVGLLAFVLGRRSL